MQGLTDPPRENLTAAQVSDLLTGQGVTRGFGCDLLDSDNRLVKDISADVYAPWKITHDNLAEIHRGVTIELTRELAWGRDRIRPWVRLSKGAVSAKFYRGVFILSTPERQYGRTPAVFTCTGKDLLTLLARQVNDTYVATAGTTYLQAFRDVLTAAGISTPPRLDGTKQDTALPADRVWGFGNVRWLDIANDLMAEIAYTDVFMSPDGTPRAQPIAPVEQRAPEHRFDTSDASTDLVDAKYAETQDLWGAYNYWRFIRRKLGYQPVVGDGLYEFTNQSDGLSSVDSIGLNPAPAQVLDVADQAALEAEGARIIAADRRTEHKFKINVDPFPIAEHRDVVELVNERGAFKMLVTSWEETPYSKGTWTLGGGSGSEPAQPAESTATATVTQVSPLRVVIDGATTDSPATVATTPAEVDNGDGTTTPVVPASFAIGDRVTATIRNPQPPLVQGKES